MSMKITPVRVWRMSPAAAMKPPTCMIRIHTH